MKRTAICLLAVLFVVALCGMAASADTLATAKKKGVFVCGVKDSTPGFGYIDVKSREIIGYDVDFCRAIAKKMGVKLELKPVTSASRMPQLIAGNIDMIAATMTKTADRARQIDFSYTYFFTGQKFITRKGEVKKLADLAGKRIGTVKGSSSELNAHKALRTSIFLSFDDYPQAFLALQQGKVAAVTTDESILANILAKAPDKTKYEIPNIQISDEPYGLGMRKGDRNLVNFVNKTLIQMEKNGEAKKIFVKWFGPTGLAFQMDRGFKIAAVDDQYHGDYSFVNKSLELPSTSKEVNIQKQGPPPNLVISSINLTESSKDHVLDAEETGVINMTLTNKGKGVAEGVNLKLRMNTPLRGLVFEDLVYVGTVRGGDSKSINVDVSAREDISSGDANIHVLAVESNGFDSLPVILSFKTRKMTPPALRVVNAEVRDSDDYRFISKGKESNISLSIENAGSGKARNVTARITTLDHNIKLLNDNTIRVGEMYPGEIKKATFNIVVTNRYNGSTRLPISFFIDEQRSKFSIKPNITMTLGEEAQSTKVVKINEIDTPKHIRVLLADEDDINEIPHIKKEERVFSADDVAVVIGIEKYQNLPKSEYSYNDAKLVRSYLKELGFQDRNIEFITDNRATLSGISKIIEKWLPNRVKERSRVLIFYSGHGSPNPTNGEPYIVPSDGDPNYLEDTGYPLKRLYNNISKLKSKESAIIIDSCFSGAGGRSVLAKGARPAIAKIEDPVLLSTRMIVLTSTAGAQISTSFREKESGVFTYYFLKSIKKGKRNLIEIYEYIKPLVEDEARRQNVDQSPSIQPSEEIISRKYDIRK